MCLEQEYFSNLISPVLWQKAIVRRLSSTSIFAYLSKIMLQKERQSRETQKQKPLLLADSSSETVKPQNELGKTVPESKDMLKNSGSQVKRTQTLQGIPQMWSNLSNL